MTTTQVKGLLSASTTFQTAALIRALVSTDDAGAATVEWTVPVRAPSRMAV
jgi:hypothetical protein